LQSIVLASKHTFKNDYSTITFGVNNHNCVTNLADLKDLLHDVNPEEGLVLISRLFGSKAKFSSALGIEDQVITHWIGTNKLAIEIFTLDTGRLFQESYDLLDITGKKYSIPIHVFFPRSEAVEKLLSEKGPNSFYESVENRKECCFIRKVEPLQRALKNTSVWITGIRADQSNNRGKMELIEWDEQHHVIKYNPLLNWTWEEVSQHIEDHKIPINTLHKKGFPSIGCAPCTRAVLPGEDFRAGRWWWESSSKECGLHTTKNEAEK
jgi:phosphoadenosine phosphosulfate reductase